MNLFNLSQNFMLQT